MVRRMVVAVACTGVIALGACGGSPPVPQRVRSFTSTDRPIATSGVTADDGAWRIERQEAGSVSLYEIADASLGYTSLTYRARLKAKDVTGKAYLEMWVRVPGRGEFFSRGLAQPVRGTQEWATYETPFLLNERDANADLVKLNVAFEGGGGTLWVKDVEVLQTPLP